jgi:hypothetical protein
MASVLDLSSKAGGWIMLLRVLSPFAFVGGAAAGMGGAWLVLRTNRGWVAKLWAILLAASFLTVLWSAFAFHLMSFRAGY